MNMRKLILNDYETMQLEKYGAVEITRNGFDILIEKRSEWEILDDNYYDVTIVNPYDKVVLKK